MANTESTIAVSKKNLEDYHKKVKAKIDSISANLSYDPSAEYKDGSIGKALKDIIENTVTMKATLTDGTTMDITVYGSATIETS